MNIKNKTILVIIITLIITIIVGASTKINDRKSFKKDGVLYALTIDGKIATSFPSKGLYKTTVSCENANGKWLYDDWKLSIENVTGDVSCYIDFITISKTYLNSYVTSLADTTQGTGKVVNENGYRYEGKNPNNYIWFNNEYWRIIGVFDSETHGQSGKNLVKIIRNDTLGGLVWNTTISSDWATSTLKLLLNDSYYNAQDGTDSGYCYGYSTSIKTNCDYTKKGIQSGYRSMIANVTWYLGGISSNEEVVSTYYSYERGTAVYSGNSTETEGYIGLMYPSDYGYSVLSNTCSRSTKLNSYYSYSCSSASWLYNKLSEWLLTGWSDRNSTLFGLASNGKLLSYYSGGLDSTYSNVNFASTNGYNVRPVLYLDSSVYVIDGDGSLLNPYIIGM